MEQSSSEADSRSDNKATLYGTWSFTADHSGRAVWGINSLRPLERWGCGFESHSRNGGLYELNLFVLFYVYGRVLAMGWSPVAGEWRPAGMWCREIWLIYTMKKATKNMTFQNFGTHL
jgi:hypothetical protein